MLMLANLAIINVLKAAIFRYFASPNFLKE